MKRSGSVCVCALLLASILLIAVPALAMASSWEQFQKDEVNTGKTTDLAPLNATKAWKMSTHTDDWGMAGVDVAPIMAEGKVFVIDARGCAWALDAKNGEKIWNESLNCEGWQFQLATPAYGEGKVFFATNDGHVYALDPQNGTTLWTNNIAATYDQLNTPVTYADGKVYVGSYKSDDGTNATGIYYCLDASTGDVLWSRPSDTGKGYYWAGACVIGDYLIYGDRASVLTSVYKDNGAEVDEINITDGGSISFNKSDAGGIRSSVACSEGFVYFTSEGEYVWKIGFNESMGGFTEEGWVHEIGYSSSTPVVYGGKVYVGTGSFAMGGKLYCLNALDREERWFFEPNGGVKASPAISIQGENSYIYFTTNCANSRAYCVDGNGNEMWNFTTEEAGTSGGYILQGVAISDGYVYFSNDGGYVYGLKEAGPVIFWEGEVALTENTTFNVTGYNSGENYEINQTTALGALDAASAKGGFNYTVSDEYGFLFIDSIAGLDYNPVTWDSWFYWVNGADPGVGAAQYELNEGDTVSFFYGQWGVTPDNASMVIRIGVHVKKLTTDWEQFHYDVANTGNSPANAPDTNQTKWITDDIGAVASSQAMIVGDKVFVYGNDHVVALNKSSGVILWNTSIPGDTQGWGSWASPAYDEDMLFVSAGYNLTKLNATTGAKLQEIAFSDGGYSCNGGPTVADGMVFAGSGTGARYYAFDESDLNTVVWNYTVAGGANSVPAVADNKVVFGESVWSGNANLYCVDMSTGDLIWSTPVTGSIWGSAAIDGANNRVYVATCVDYGSDTGKLFAFALDTGAIHWSADITYTNSALAISGDYIYVSGSVNAPGITYCFNSTGTLQWDVPCGSWTMSPAVADGKLFIGKVGIWGASGICVYNSTKGTLVWSYDNAGSSPSVSEGIVVSIGSDGKVYAFEEKEMLQFDTGTPDNPYPSIFGTHNGTITPNQTITVSKLYTYPCSGTGGHTEFAMIWNETTGDCAVANWNGYQGDYHNISFNRTLTLKEGVVYNYTICTGSYPQIHHNNALPTVTGWINCTEFTDANGKKYNNWIPAIRLW